MRFAQLMRTLRLPPIICPRQTQTWGRSARFNRRATRRAPHWSLPFGESPASGFPGRCNTPSVKPTTTPAGSHTFREIATIPRGDWALSDNDRRHKFDLLASSQPTRYFTVGAALSVYSGKPVNITTGADNNHDGIVNDRPGGVPRNAMPGPGMIELDLNLAHDFVLSKSRKEARTLTVALNSFNVLNHVNDMTYIGIVTSPFFGHAVAALPPRRMQLDVQFKF